METVAEERPNSTWGSEDFSQIYAAYSQSIYYLALRFLGDPERAQDAMHDVFLKAYRKYDQFRGDAAIRTWLYRITINHCQNQTKSWHSRNLISNSDDPIWERTEARGDDPLEVLEKKELGQRIQKSLDSLPEEYRLLLLLVADEKLSYDQIATLTEQSADSVRGKLHRARKAFAVNFKKTG